MGGKGSGRKRKPLSKVLEDVQDELLRITELTIDEEIQRRAFNLISRLSYHVEQLRKVQE